MKRGMGTIDLELEEKAGQLGKLAQDLGQEGTPTLQSMEREPTRVFWWSFDKSFISGPGYGAFWYGHIVGFAFYHALHAFVVVESLT